MSNKNDDDTKSKKRQCPRAARLDANRYGVEHAKCHSPANISTAKALGAMCTNAYIRSRVFVTPRANFISVKIENECQADRIQSAAQIKSIKSFCKANNIEGAKKGKHFIYRVK